jgi:hypothetical protein
MTETAAVNFIVQDSIFQRSMVSRHGPNIVLKCTSDSNRQVFSPGKCDVCIMADVRNDVDLKNSVVSGTFYICGSCVESTYE